MNLYNLIYTFLYNLLAPRRDRFRSGVSLKFTFILSQIIHFHIAQICMKPRPQKHFSASLFHEIRFTI